MPDMSVITTETVSLIDRSDMPNPDMVFLSLGSSVGQLEDLASGASGLPRQQVPIPSQASPPPLSIYDRPLEGSAGKGWSPEQVWVYLDSVCALMLILGWCQAR